ncbi:MAG: hypothetical protein JXC85_03885 [Candidatus Aenigmarchaeota archaeon]|nr:hypothetical protein [Candidatus Aenigmarchaeota archaeon]
MLGMRLLQILVVAALLAAGIYLQPAFTGFFAFVTGTDSRLGVWDSSEALGGNEPAFINEPVFFFANFTNLTSSEPINGSGVYCEIRFNETGAWSAPAAMYFDAASSLYAYNRTFSNIGNFSWNVLCDGAAGGFETLNVTDSDGIYLNRYEWWNDTWGYRMRFVVDTGDSNVSNWPVEWDLNFTDVLRQVGASGTFDENSTRLVEYNLSGGAMHELPSQFDQLSSYDPFTNAAGNAVFIMNGTTTNGTRRVFYMHFDTLENGAKPYRNYATNLTYVWSGDEFHFNTTRLYFFLDTNRSENASGLFKIYSGGSPPFIFLNDYEYMKTVEYIEYSNGTDSFGFRLFDDVTLVPGPVRLTIVQTGNETYWGNASLPTNEGMLTKKYYVYNHAGQEKTGTFIKIEQNFTNAAGYGIDRNSTEAGALAFDVGDSWGSYGGSVTSIDQGNKTDPFSWFYALSSYGDLVGVINLNETAADFFATNNSAGDRIGIQLSAITVSPGQSITEKAVAYFGKGTGQTDEFLALKDAIRSPPVIVVGGFGQRTLASRTETDLDIYNRNETAFITVNITYDPYSLLQYVNLSLDNGTPSPDDDINMTMYDDGTNGDLTAGDGVYTNTYQFAYTANTGKWEAIAWLYDGDLVLLNISSKQFNVTKELFVNVTIYNPTGISGRAVNASVDVLSFRQDVWHPAATMNCSIYRGATELFDVHPDNITDLNNGSYFVKFKSPLIYGLYTLNCSANKTGNEGFGTEDFTTEALETNMSISVFPASYIASNVTWINNQSFLVTVNATNTENGTAYNTTINLGLPQNLTSDSSSASCGMVLISKTCSRDFNITVWKTTAPWNFSVLINVTWDNTNPTSDFNETYLTVNVTPTHVLDVLEENVSATVAAGIPKNIANLTLRSFGNAELENVTFNVTGFVSQFNFTFVPPNITAMAPGNVSQVPMWLEVESGYPSGDYSGTVNISSGNGGYEELPINVTVSGTNLTLNVSPANFTADIITYFKGQSFSVFVNSTNVENATAYAVNITLNFSSPFINTSNTTNYECGNLGSSESCPGSYLITVSNGTPSGNYTVNVSVIWDNPEIGMRMNSSLVDIFVLSNVTVIIPEDVLNGTVTHGTTGIIGNFTMNCTGNDPVEGMEFTVLDPLSELDDFTIKVIPNITATAGGNLTPGSFVRVNLSVSVPLSYPPGEYSGLLNITSDNGGYKTLSMAVNVPASRTWAVPDPADLFCEHSESPEEGVLCNVTINNSGNVNITFNIYPATSSSSMFNYTWTEFVNFQVENQTAFKFSVFYNISGANITLYNASYNISAVQGSPSHLNLTVILSPNIAPLIGVSAVPGIIPQLGNLEIWANVTSQSGIPINFTRIYMTRPDDTVDSILMRRFGSSTDPYEYLIGYPFDSVNGTWGDSTLRGNYTFSVYTEDNIGLNKTANGSFYAYAVMDVSLQTARSSGLYYQGETGTIDCHVTDLSGSDLPGVNVSIGIMDPTNRTLNLNNANFITNTNGESDTLPNFALFSDSPTGIYNMTATSVFNDTPISYIVTNTTKSYFMVVESQPGIVQLELEGLDRIAQTSEDLSIVAILTNGVENIDPDSISATLYTSTGFPLDPGFPVRMGPGRYNWTVDSEFLAAGIFRWEVTASYKGKNVTKDLFQRLVGALFDVNVTETDNTIPDLQALAKLTNTGDEEVDVDLAWNLTIRDTGENLRAGGTTVKVAANSVLDHYIDIPGITYLGWVKITVIIQYGPYRAGAFWEFETVEEGPPGPQPPGPTPGPEGPEGPEGGGIGPAPKPQMEIVDYPEEITTEVGWAQYPSVTVNNTGTTTLHNIRIRIDGIPSSWYTVEPLMLPLLNPGVGKTFVINLIVPVGTEARQYFGTINATANETYDEELTSIIVFGSREELVRYQLKKLKEEFKDFREDVNATAEEGLLDLSRVYDIIDEIQNQIDMTEGYLDAKMFDEALNAVTTGWRLLERGRELLLAAPPLRAITMFMIPDWVLTLVMLLIISILVLVILLSRYRKRIERTFKREVPEVTAAKEMIGAGPAMKGKYVEKDAAAAARKEEEKAKIIKVLNLLEKEYNQGIISENAYKELRKRNMEKLKALGW